MLVSVCKYIFCCLGSLNNRQWFISGSDSFKKWNFILWVVLEYLELFLKRLCCPGTLGLVLEFSPLFPNRGFYFKVLLNVIVVRCKMHVCKDFNRSNLKKSCKIKR